VSVLLSAVAKRENSDCASIALRRLAGRPFFLFRLFKTDQSRQLFNPELDVAKELGCEFLRLQLALAQKFPVFRRRILPTITPLDSPYLHRLFRGHFLNFSFAAGDTPIYARLSNSTFHAHFSGGASSPQSGPLLICSDSREPHYCRASRRSAHPNQESMNVDLSMRGSIEDQRPE
jgi:hypothetical protein